MSEATTQVARRSGPERPDDHPRNCECGHRHDIQRSGTFNKPKKSCHGCPCRQFRYKDWSKV